MKNINQLIDVVGQSHHHMPALLSLLIGLLCQKKEAALFNDNDGSVGDNIPATLMDGLNV